jgi:hypothetical protein
MLRSLLETTIMASLIFWPAFILPLLLGPFLSRLSRHDHFGRLAQLLTLKPLLAYPLWLFFTLLGRSLSLQQEYALALGLAPGVLLTLFILRSCRRSLRAERGVLLMFLLLDALRWLNGLTLVLGGDPGLSYMLAIILPNTFTLMAFLVMWTRGRYRRRVARAALAQLATLQSMQDLTA